MQELYLFLQKNRLEAGCDEAGRGCLAGPVVAAAVILDPKKVILGLNDSKKLNEKQRLVLKDEIINNNPKKKEIVKSDLSEDFLNLIKINMHKEWSLSIKTLAALRDLDIIHVGDLISYEKKDLLKARNFGNKSLEELTDYMALYNLSFGTYIKDWNLIRSNIYEQ